MTEFGPGLGRDYSRSRALLLGVSNYVYLPPVPPARNSLTRMASLLTGPLCGWPGDRVHVLHDAPRRDNLPDQLMQMVDGISDIALFYFVGHGQLHGDDLCLALAESPETGPRRLTTGLPFADVRAALRECEAHTKIVILDCCFAGHAAQSQHSLAGRSTDLIDRTLGTGAFTMAASGVYRTAWFESDPTADYPQTYFSKYLIDTVERGLPGYPEGLPLGAIFAHTADMLARDRRPEPTRSVRHDADRFVLARNVAAAAEVVAAEPPEQPAGSSVRARFVALSRAGKALAITGLVLVLAVAGGAAVLLESLTSPHHSSTASDPGCVYFNSHPPQVPTSAPPVTSLAGLSTAERNDLNMMRQDQEHLNAAASRAKSQAVKQALEQYARDDAKAISDTSEFDSEVAAGGTVDDNTLNADTSQAVRDGDTLMTLCGMP